MPNYTKQELAAAADQIFHNIAQLFSYFAWFGKIAPSLDSKTEGTKGHIFFVLAQNAVIDGFLINLRRLNEFFSNRPENDKKDQVDDLRAYHFEFPEIGRFLDEKDMCELHKRIAHSTSRTVKYGEVTYEVMEATELALKHCFKFIGFLHSDFYKENCIESENLKNACKGILALLYDWQDEVAMSRKKLK